MPVDPKTTVRWSLLAAGLLAFFMLGAGQSVMGPALPVFQQRFAIGGAAAGWLISSLAMGSFAGLVVLYFYGRFATPALALLVMTAGALAIALSPNFAATIAACILFGFGYGCVAAQFNARIFAVFGQRGPSMLSLLNAGYSVGAIFAPLLFVALGSRPNLMFVIIAGLTGLATLVMMRPQPAVTPATEIGLPKGFRFSFPILIFGLIAVGVEVSLTGLGPSAMIRAGVADAHAAELLSAFFVAFLIGRLGLTLLADRVPSFAVLIAAALLTAACSFACIWFDPTWFFPPMGAAAGLLFPGYFVTAAARMGNDSRVSPVILATTQIGAITFPLLIAQLAPMMGERGFFWLIALTTTALGLVGLVSFRRLQP